MSLKDRITEDMKSAMRAKDADRLGTIRMLMAAIKQREVDERITLDDIQVMAALEKMIKTRKESIEQFRAGNRDDLADKEAREIEQLKVYLPEQLSADELAAVITTAITSVGASSIKDMGKVVAAVKQQAAGRADMTVVSAAIKAKLGG
ncbi:MAG: GatB/YqeY domain-containing protein [Steroidobacteraceae bacterium]